MKRLQPLVILALISVMSCENNDPVNFDNPILKVGDNAEFNYSDFEMYDSSAKVLYFKASYPEFVDYKGSEFSFYADAVLIYKGYFWSSYSSSFPSTPYVTSDPFFYQYHALGFEYTNQNQPDPRNDSRLMSAFKEKDLLHSGLSVSSESVIVNGTQVTFSCMITNRDEDGLYLLDFDKMGTNLFHYYTNGLIFVNETQPEIIYCITDPQGPIPYNSWKMEWLSLVRSGESIQLDINYSLESPLKKGTYTAYFSYPGFTYQISKDDLIQGNGRIWLGEVTGSKKIIIQ